MIDLSKKKILVTGAYGFFGRHLVRNLVEKRGVSQENLVLPRRADFDLRVWEHCKKVVEGVDVIFHLAANVGGLGYNKENPGSMFYDNIIMGTQLMEAARQTGVEKFIVTGTVCCYPEDAPVPTKEEHLWQGDPEENTAPYGLAKLMLLVQGRGYEKQHGFKSIFLIPANLYGPEDHFDPTRSHVTAALVKRFVDAVKNDAPYVEVWGTGNASREFIYIEDAAEGMVLAAERGETSTPINLGTGVETPIKEIAELIKKLTDFTGEIRWDATKPDGRLRRKLDVSKAKRELGFEAKTPLEEGLKKTIEWYKENT